jgi:hypothetical protein
LSLNLGNDAIDALVSLRGNAEFKEFHAKLGEMVNTMTNAALEPAEGAMRDDRCGYARALRDLWIAIESAITNEKYNAVKKPGPIQTRARAYSP